MKALQFEARVALAGRLLRLAAAQVTASTDGGRALHSSGKMGETPRDGWPTFSTTSTFPTASTRSGSIWRAPPARWSRGASTSIGGRYVGSGRARRAHRRSIRKVPDAGRLRQAEHGAVREALDRTGPRPKEAPGASGVRDVAKTRRSPAGRNRASCWSTRGRFQLHFAPRFPIAP